MPPVFRNPRPGRRAISPRPRHDGPMAELVAARPRALALRVWAFLRSAPGTFAWLAVLLVTTIVMNQFSPQFRYRFVLHHSTNLHELSHNPVRVLISSALWTDGSRWWPYLILYCLFHAPVERRLGTARW